MQKLSISLAQIKITPGNLSENVQRAVSLIHAAITAGSEMVILPELWSSGYQLKDRYTVSRANLEILKSLKSIANQHHIWIGGSLVEQKGDDFFNSFFLINPDHAIDFKYQKTHLFKPMKEDLWFSPGEQAVSFQSPWGQIGLAICYDLRFPELFRRYALDGVKICLISAEWPLSRIEHWKVLVQARAIENQYFVAAVNCVGKSNTETFGGNSLIVAPDGRILAMGGQDEEEMVTADLVLSDLAKLRASFPVLSDRRPDVYDREP